MHDDVLTTRLADDDVTDEYQHQHHCLNTYITHPHAGPAATAHVIT